MTVSDVAREVVRQRAQYACEYCGLREQDVSGRLTIDHFRPLSKGGNDDIENLIYSCIWCNQRKLDYWADAIDSRRLWNPRQDDRVEHFLLLHNGLLQPLTQVGNFSIQRLQLNRPALIAYRLRQNMLYEQSNLLVYYRDQVNLQDQLVAQLTRLIEEQQTVLEEQQRLLDLLLQRGQR